MSDYYETGAGLRLTVANGATKAGEIDWHGFGKLLTAGASRDVQLVEAGLDWTVAQRPVFVDGREVPNMAACVRVNPGKHGDGSVFYIGDAKRNKIDFRQNAEVYDEVQSIAPKLGIDLSYLCAIKGGTSVIFTYAPQDNTYTDPTGSQVAQYFSIIVNRSQGNRTLHFLQASIRAVCANTEAQAIREASETGKQTRIISSARISEGDIAAALEQVYKGMTFKREMQQKMANDKLTDAEAARLFADVAGINLADLDRTTRNSKGEVVPVVSTKARNILAALNLSYRNAPGATPGTAYGALNAITHYTTHVRTVRDTMGDGEQGARVAANMIGDGAAMVAKAQAMLATRYAMAA